MYLLPQETVIGFGLGRPTLLHCAEDSRRTLLALEPAVQRGGVGVVLGSHSKVQNARKERSTRGLPRSRLFCEATKRRTKLRTVVVCGN